MLKVKNKNC